MEHAFAPVAVASSEGFSRVAAGSYHTSASTPVGGLFCWGSNDYGQLGDGGPSQGWLIPVSVWR